MYIGEDVVAIHKETFNVIEIYGFGKYNGIDDESGKYIVKFSDGETRLCIRVVPTRLWAEYVDDRCAEVLNIEGKM